MWWSHKKAFTLIELLVVVAIISLLSTIVLSSLSEARAKARDQALYQSVQELQKALELYKEDNNGLYPGEELQPYYYYNVINNDGILDDSYNDGARVDLKTYLAPYISTALTPTAPNTEAWYWYDGAFRCFGYDTSARYNIFIQPETSALDFLPGYVYENNGPENTEFRCISGPR